LLFSSRMSAIVSAARRREKVSKPSRRRSVCKPPSMVISEPVSNLDAGAGCSQVDLGDPVRLVLMLTPAGPGAVREQVREVLSVIRSVLRQQPQPIAVTFQTVFLKRSRDQAECERAFAEFYGSALPVSNFVLQAPCCGAALALEAWAIGGKAVRVERLGPEALAISYDSVRWVYCAGVAAQPSLRGAFPQALDALGRLRTVLASAGSSFPHVVRTWFYLGGITEPEADAQRYHELNRARAEFYESIPFHCSSPKPRVPRGVYPASTGIGMAGSGLVSSCIALETRRDDVFLLPLENPRQIPAYTYDPRHSPQSPKFSRAVALVLGDYVTTWVSGTASIVHSESCHLGDPERQTVQTIDNIERLIAAANFASHGLKGAGASLQDLAKIRVYLKRPTDLAKCRAICERRFGPVPAIYAVADICRPELLIEIEGVAFSRLARG
jgi:enamine deaminase RidA (YjgF/YER057c/UK114 family)